MKIQQDVRNSTRFYIKSENWFCKFCSSAGLPDYLIDRRVALKGLVRGILVNSIIALINSSQLQIGKDKVFYWQNHGHLINKQG